MDLDTFLYIVPDNLLDILKNRDPNIYNLLIKYDTKYINHIDIEREDEREYKIARDYLYMIITSSIFVAIMDELKIDDSVSYYDLMMASDKATSTIFKAVIDMFCINLPNHKKKFSEIEYLSEYFKIDAKTFSPDNISYEDGVIYIKECYLSLIEGYDKETIWYDIINDRSKVNLLDTFKLARYDFDNILKTLDIERR